jgi:predicted RNase H-like HicB family nuclease
MPSYFAIVHRTATNEFEVQFPDCPGCAAAGATFGEAERLAGEALQRYLEALVAEGGELPTPSPVSTIKKHPASRGGAVIAVAAMPQFRKTPGARKGVSGGSRSRRKAESRSG